MNKHKRAIYYGSGSSSNTFSIGRNKTPRRPQSAGHLRRAVTTGNLRSRRRTDPLRRICSIRSYTGKKEREMNTSIEESKRRNTGREKYVLKRKISSKDTVDRCKNPYRQPSLAVDAEAKIENANVELSFQDKCKKPNRCGRSCVYP